MRYREISLLQAAMAQADKQIHLFYQLSQNAWGSQSECYRGEIRV